MRDWKAPAVIGLLLVCSAGVSPAVLSSIAQDAPISPAVEEIAAALKKTNVKTVIVFDFSGPNGQITVLGQQLADDFNSELASAAPKLRLESRSRIADAIKNDEVALNFEADPSAELAFAERLHTQASVTGQMSVTGGQVLVQLAAYDNRTGKSIGDFNISWIEDSDEKILEQKKLVQTIVYGIEADYPEAVKEGYTAPKCFYTPKAEYTPEAMEHKIVGTVELQAVVGEDGRFRDIYVRKALPYGLSLAAAKAVKNWECTPAKGPDGKPAAVRVIIEANFQLSR